MNHKTLVDLFLECATTYSQRIFCQYKSTSGPWVSMTYQRTKQRVLSLASGLHEMGLKPGDGLAILAKTRWEWVALELAALRVGAFVTGIETHGSKEDVHFRMEHSGVRGAVIEAEALPLVSESALRKLDFVILLDSATSPLVGSKEITFDQLEKLGNARTLEEIPLPASENIAALLYTSGTTGTPKAIRYRHQQVVAAVEAVQNAFPDVDQNDSVLCWLPLAHLFQRMINYVAISCGAPMAFLGDPKKVLEAAKEIRPTIFLGVPRFFEKLALGMEEKCAAVPAWIPRFLIHPRLRGILGGRVRLLITGSAPTPAATLDFFHRIGLPLYEAYGVSENTLPISMNTPSTARRGSVGRPLKGNTVRVTKDGEICIKGPGVCEGYWKSETEFPLDEEGFYHTGDIGRRDEEGYLHLFGRQDDIFKTSTGRKIVPTHLESIYGTSPLFERVMAIGRGKPFPTLLVWLKETSPAGREVHPVVDQKRIADEIARLGAQLLPYERVGGFLVVAENPDIASGTLTASLKLRRKNIEERFALRIEALYRSLEVAPHLGDSSQRQNRPPVGTMHENPGRAPFSALSEPERRGDRPRVLFVAEAVALSHPARLLEIARQLDPETYEIHFAADPRYQAILGPVPFFFHKIESIPASEFDRTVARGGVFFTEDVIEKYVRQECSLFEKIQPDVVVGEFRPSLGISARIASVPYVSILNAYYNPTAQVRHILPEYRLTEWIPPQISQWFYNHLRSWGYARHGHPVNAVRRRYGLSPLIGDLRHALADADWTLFPDLKSLFPRSSFSETQRFMAPVSWSPEVPLPTWWESLPTDRPVVYANLGSSGRHGVLQRVLNALSPLPLTVIAATAGRQSGLTVPANVFITDFLPGQEASRRASLVITNGGNMSGYQALTEGKPILGLASNVDQFLNMAVLEDAGVGKLLRAGSFSTHDLQYAAGFLMNDPMVRSKTIRMSNEIATASKDEFNFVLENILGKVRKPGIPQPLKVS